MLVPLETWIALKKHTENLAGRNHERREKEFRAIKFYLNRFDVKQY